VLNGRIAHGRAARLYWTVWLFVLPPLRYVLSVGPAFMIFR
jgi:hypothetical protein